MSEQWRPVVGFEGFYSVSDHGNVRSEYRLVTYAGRWGKETTRPYYERLMGISLDSAGYPRVRLCRGGRVATHRVHALVLEAFHPKPELRSTPHVRHLDDNKQNNHLSNLAWGTASDNAADAVRNGIRIGRPQFDHRGEDTV